MDGFTVTNANKFLETGSFSDRQSLRIDGPKDSISGINTDLKSNTENKTFSETLKDAVQSVNQLQKSADKASQELATGRTDNVADVMIAAEKADIALRVMVQVRNKIIDAYQEIMKMQV